MNHFRNIEQSLAYLKLFVFAGLMVASTLYGLGLNSLLDDEEKIFLFADADGFDAEDKENDQQNTSLDVDFFTLLNSSKEFILNRTSYYFNAHCSFENLPSSPKYILYHQLKIDC